MLTKIKKLYVLTRQGNFLLRALESWRVALYIKIKTIPLESEETEFNKEDNQKCRRCLSTPAWENSNNPLPYIRYTVNDADVCKRKSLLYCYEWTKEKNLTQLNIKKWIKTFFL